jgi:regulator of nucleoside diphosphate kinase
MKALFQDIVLTQFDHNRLRGLLQVFRKRSAADPRYLDALEAELRRARTVGPDAIPSDVVTMNSKVALRNLLTGERMSLTLVFPEAMAHGGQYVSVLSPLGLALLGCHVGDLLEDPQPTQPRRLLVEEVEFQPEARGNFCM